MAAETEEKPRFERRYNHGLTDGSLFKSLTVSGGTSTITDRDWLVDFRGRGHI